MVRWALRHSCVLVAAPLAAAALVACGSEAEPDPSAAAPETSSFPAVEGRSVEQLVTDIGLTEDVVVSPAGAVYEPGDSRFGFGVFDVGGEQIADAQVAIYAQPAEGGRAVGPLPARIESLEAEPRFTAQSTADDPEATEVVYVAEVPFEQPGEWRLVAVVDTDEGQRASRLPSVMVAPNDEIPAVGDPAPRIHTPTAADAGNNLASIDTRVPASSMHEDDLADVLGKEPAVLLFATPALCQVRVCGPVVDVAEQVKADYGDEAAFIHMEIYEDNKPPKLRSQVTDFGLPTEPWLFVIDRDGKVSERIEGAFSVDELEAAVQKVAN